MNKSNEKGSVDGSIKHNVPGEVATSSCRCYVGTCDAGTKFLLADTKATKGNGSSTRCLSNFIKSLHRT